MLLPLLFTIGLGAGTINPLAATVRQERAPRHLRGRVLATGAAVVAITAPIGTLLGGLAVEVLGLRGALAVIAAANVALSLAAVALLARRTISLEPVGGVR